MVEKNGDKPRKPQEPREIPARRGEPETDKQRQERIDRIDEAAQRWRQNHPGQPVPWQIGG